MKTHTADGRWFLLSAECEADSALLDAIDLGTHRVQVVRMLRAEGRNIGIVLNVDRNDPRSRRDEAASQLARAFGELIRLGTREIGALRAPPTTGEAAREIERLQTLERSAAANAGHGREAAP